MISKYNKDMKTDKTIYLIGRIHEQANKFLLNELEQIGFRDISPSHGDILVTLFQYKECTMTDLSNSIHRDRSTVTALVNKLIKLGYITSRKADEDNRSTIIALTQKGMALEAGFQAISDKLFDVEYQGISAEEKEVFQKVLQKVLDNF
ncbi:MAG: transcriptional regulator [Anaerocolumna sp.]|nr:transcriptional regulator [Anaerocolumna sp.]